jgi:DeoR/GlpR family transcriptional regulator of sugar metabolism
MVRAQPASLQLSVRTDKIERSRSMDMSVAELPEVRRQRLAEMLQRDGEIRLPAAARALGVSEMTVRRDLELLQVQGLAKRVHGGAVSVQPAGFAGRAERAIGAKLIIAGKLLALLPEHGTVVFDASSTVASLATRVVGAEEPAFFTNGVETFRALSQRERTTVHLLGGQFDRHTSNLVGPLTMRALDLLYFDLAIMSCSGLDVRFGATEATLDDAAVKARMLELSTMKILAVDRAKLGLRGPVRLAPLQQFDVLVTDLDPDHRDLRDYRAVIDVL